MNPACRKAAALVGLALVLTARAEAPPTTAPIVTTTTTVGGKTLKEWIADMKGITDPSVREECIRAVTCFGDASREAVPALLDRLHDSDLSPRVKATIALGIVPVDEKDLPKVIEALGKLLAGGGETQAIVRFQAAMALASKGKDAKAALPQLIAGTTDSYSWEIRKVCVGALVLAGGDEKNGPDAKATHALLKAVEDPANQVRLEAVMSLGEMGRPGEAPLRAAAIKALQNAATGDRDKAVQIWAHVSRMALEKVDDKGLNYLADELKTKDSAKDSLKIRVHSARGLGALGKEAKEKIPDLLDALNDKEPDVVVAACSALRCMGGEAVEKARATLKGLAESKDANESQKQAAGMGLEMLKDPPPKK
jgi:HEAT repeat protein